jgi:hypothetical protein
LSDAARKVVDAAKAAGSAPTPSAPGWEI